MDADGHPHYPHIRVTGGPLERGTAYGGLARDRVRGSLTAYSAAFSAAGCSWGDAQRTGRGHRDAIHDVDPALGVELTGIAGGAGVEEDDILALNARTEIMARWGGGGAPRTADGCTAVAVAARRTADGHALLAQNWDWLTHVRDTVVILEVERVDAPSYVTVVEAGLVAKVSMTSAGLAVGTNFLLTEQDGRGHGVPYHLVLRALLDCGDAQQAHALLRSVPHASSCNVLLVDAQGTTVDLEISAGKAGSVRQVMADDDVLAHANHFCAGPVAGDLSLAASPGSPRRHRRMRAVVDEAGATIRVGDLRRVLADHEGFPRSICAHSDPDRPAHQREATACGIVMQPAAGRMWLCDGSPCTVGWRETDLTWFAAEPTVTVHG